MIKKFFYFLIFFQISIAYSYSIEINKYSSIYEIKEINLEKNKAILIFSSRYYIDKIREFVGDNPNIYWILPFSEIKKSDLQGFLDVIESKGRNVKINFESDGIIVEEEGLANYKIVSYLDISKIVYEKVDLILDVDFFFRMYINTISRVNNEKTLEIMKFYRSIEEYGLIPEKFYLILSRDINLPDWVDEFGFLLEKIYFNWVRKEYPKSYILLDEAGKYIVFAQYEEAYDILLEVFPEQIDNPFFYEKMMIVSSRLFAFNDMLKAFEEGYKLRSNIINLVPDIAGFLLDKGEYYPAFLLAKSAYEKEIWNTEIKKIFENVVYAGYNYYNKLNEDDELFRFFKSELEKLRKK